MASKTALKTREKGAGSIYREGKRWYLRVRASGKSTTKMLRNKDGSPCTNEKDANTAADGYRKILLAEDKEDMALQIAEAKKLKRQSSLLLLAAWETYLNLPDRPDSSPSTLAKYQSYLKTFLAWIQKVHPEIDRVAAVDKEIVREYLAELWQSGISGRTYNAYVQALRMIFKYLMEPAALESNPFERASHKVIVTVSRHEFTEEQVEAIFAGFREGFFYETEVEQLAAGRQRVRLVKKVQYHPMFEEEMRVLLNLCCWTGCRGQDGCLMEWRNVDLSTKRISYIPRKTARKTGHKAVTLPLQKNLAEALRDAMAWRNNNLSGEDYILPNVAHRYLSNPSGVQKDVMKIIRCATGLSTTDKTTENKSHRKLAANAYSLHSFRHTFVSFCANAGVPLAIVAEIVGHGNPAMTQHYSHITTEAKQGAINALPRMAAIPETKTLPATSNLDEQLTAAISRMTDEQKLELLDYCKTHSLLL